MNSFTAKVRCPECGTGFRVELQRMRFNAPIPCPSCGARCNISPERAIRAHRILERLEYRTRAAAGLTLAAIAP
jgi:hypothetical protein